MRANYKRLLQMLRRMKQVIPDKAALHDFASYKHRAEQRIEQLQCSIQDIISRKRVELLRCPKSGLTKEEEDTLRAELEKLRLNNKEKEKQTAELRGTNEAMSTELNCLKRKYESVTLAIEKSEVMKTHQQEKERLFYESRATQDILAKARAAEAKSAEFEAVAFSFKKALNEELKKSMELRQELHFYRSDGKGSDAEQREAKLRNIVSNTIYIYVG